MTRTRAALAAAIISIFLTSCGATFRPIALPEPGSGPPAQDPKTAAVITGTAATGQTTHFNLSGATISGTASIGANPVHAALVGARIVTANASPTDSLTFFGATSPQSSLPTTTTLPAGANPSFVYPLGANVYVAYKGLNKVGVVNTGTLAETGSVAVGTAPVAIISTFDGRKLYVANSGSSNVTVIDTTSLSVITTINFSSPTCIQPSWFTIRADGQAVYVVCKGSAAVHIINTNTDDQAIPNALAVGSTPSFAYFDNAKNLLGVVNTGAGTVTFFDETPTSGLHNSKTVVVGADPVWATLLRDGSRVYVAHTTGNVTVIDNAALSVKTTIPTGGQLTHIASTVDSTRVVAASDGGSPSLVAINTATETVANNFALPAPPRFLLVFP